MLEQEQMVANLNTKIGLVIESAEAGGIGLGSSTHIQKTSTATGDETITFDRLTSGVGNVQLKPGESLKAHTFDRPNVNFAPWTEFMIREISWSTGMSPELLWNMSGVGGAVTRHILQDAEVFFAEIRQILEYQYCRRFWKYWIWKSIQNGSLEYPGDDWWRCDWIPPQKLTVDTGRDGKLRLNLVQSGLLSSKRYFSELGQDVDQETDDIIRSAARRKKRVQEISQEEGVDLSVAEVFPPLPGSPPLPVEAENPTEADD
jgi:capsid protein